MKKNTVLFDFDGTIMDTNDVIVKSWQHTFREMEGKERPLEEIFATFGEPLEITMKKFFPDRDTEHALETYRSYQLDHYTELIGLFPGMKGLIQKLKSMGYRLGLVTSRLRNSTEIGLKQFEIFDCFEYIVTADDTDKHKPDPEPVLIALEKLNAEPEEAVMVGDSMFDILCAQNAGVEAVLVGWAAAAEVQNKVRAIQPEYRIQKPEELLELLKQQ